MKLGVLLLAIAGCASALHEPTPISKLAPGEAQGRTADDLVREANEAWAHKAEPGQPLRAQNLYLDAAALDEHRTDAVLGAMKAINYRLEHEQGIPRGKLVRQEVELGQWCQRRDPQNGECDYRLALAIGQQARERKATGHDALNRMVTLLRRAIKRTPNLDSGGPDRVLAIVFLRSPSWPAGPGDPEAGLKHARAAARAFPDAPQNQLALGEAFAANDSSDEARAAYERALTLAKAARQAGNPEARRWEAQAREGLGKISAR